MGRVNLDKIKVLVADGDSWTAGDIVDPNLFAEEPWHVNHPDNRPYRLPKVWPHKLASKLNLECENISIAGSSNDGIIRRTVNTIDSILQKYKPEEILYIVGWSSPERKDFFYGDGAHRHWETMYPGEIESYQGYTDELHKFYRQYVLNFWNPEEFITRYIQQVIFLDLLFKSKNIQYLFFDAFYESKESVFSKDHSLKSSKNLYDSISEKFDSPGKLKALELDNTITIFKSVVETKYIDISFIDYIIKKEKELKKEIISYHPTEEGHELWAEYLYEFIR